MAANAKHRNRIILRISMFGLLLLLSGFIRAEGLIPRRLRRNKGY